ncbi:MAG: CASTOR/POLLUX-related putative ion channel [Microthrixaceae bacterium]
MLLLALVALGAAFAGAVAFRVFHLSRDGEDLDFPQALWESMIRTLDPGQLDIFASGGNRSERWGFAIVALILTVLGVLLVASLISVINNSVSSWVERSARGRGRPPRRNAHRDYIVMLGWSDLSIQIIRELAASAASVGEAPDVLVLAPAGVRAMEQQLDELRLREQEKLERGESGVPGAVIHRRRVHFRTGDPGSHLDLLNVAAIQAASSVIVLATPRSPASFDPSSTGSIADPEHSGGSAVAEIVKTVFAIEAALDEADRVTRVVVGDHSGEPRPLPVVVEEPEYADDRSLLEQLTQVFDPPVQRSASGPEVGRPVTSPVSSRLRVISVDTSSMQSALAAQVVRQSGLSRVYLELLDFDGADLYVTDVVPKADGGSDLRFRDAAASYQGGIVIGIQTDSGPRFLPTEDPPVAGCGLIVLREHEQRTPTFEHPGGSASGNPSESNRPVELLGFDQSPIMIVGWNRRAPELLASLRDAVEPGAGIHVVVTEVDRSAATAVASVHGAAVHVVASGDLVAWVTAGGRGDALHPPLSLSSQRELIGDDPLHVVFLANERVSEAESDASILVMQKAHRPPSFDGQRATIVAEIRQRPTRALATRHEHHDLVVGHGLTALLLAQFARNPDKHEALKGLLRSHEVEINFVESRKLTTDESPQQFREVQKSASAAGVVALGIRSAMRLTINPDRTTVVQPDDDVVVLRRSRSGLE